MSHENLEIVRRMYAEARERPEALYEFLADDVHWDSTGTGQLEMSTIRGRDGVMQFFRSWIAPFDEWSYEVEELLDAGDCVIARFHQWGRGKASGVEVDRRFWRVWTLRDGKAVRTTHHLDEGTGPRGHRHVGVARRFRLGRSCCRSVSGRRPRAAGLERSGVVACRR